MKKYLAIALLSAFSLLPGAATAAAACIELESTSVADGQLVERGTVKEVSFKFTSKPDLSTSTFKITRTLHNASAIKGDIRLEGNTVIVPVVSTFAGPYHVKWTALGDCGELIQGEFKFNVAM